MNVIGDTLRDMDYSHVPCPECKPTVVIMTAESGVVASLQALDGEGRYNFLATPTTDDYLQSFSQGNFNQCTSRTQKQALIKW